MTEPDKQDQLKEEPAASEPVDELEQLCRTIERQIRSNQRFLEGFLDDNFQDQEAE